MSAPEGRASAAERAAVSKLARGSIFSRLKHSKQPLKLVAVPRDHVRGDRQRGEALLNGRFTLGSETISLKGLNFAGLGTAGGVARKGRSARGGRRRPLAARARHPN